ncbi:MAG: DUF1795 domain-containing protein [Clostridia bacterium]|nr:DUF1795 domain-containing protein [Clostridia bacterium]
MKRITKTALSSVLAALMLLTILSLFAACSDNGVPDGMFAISLSSDPYNLYVPKSWFNNSVSGHTSAYYSNADKSNISMTAMLQDYDNHLETVDDYMKTVDKSLSALLPEYSRTTEFKETTLGGRAAQSFEYTAKIDGKAYRFMQTVTLKGYDFYIFTYTAEAENYELHADDIAKILENISFK